MFRLSPILSAFLLTIAPAIAGTAAAATITIDNTAKLELRLAGATRSYDSNRVTTETVPPPTPAVVTFLRPANVDAGVVMSTDGTMCRMASGGFAPAGSTSTGQHSASLTGLTQTRTYHAGEPVYMSLADGNRNRDPAARETVEVRVTSSVGDEETLRLMETEPNSGLFAGVIASVSVPPQPTTQDCRLSLAGNATIKVAYTDSFYPTDVAEASILVDPFGIIFDSETGDPINGVTITLIEEATGQPAKVFGDDGLSAYPSTVVSGGSVRDASGTLYTFPAGGYRFPLVAPGRYRLVITPFPGYVFPSTARPEDLAVLTMPNGEPYVIDVSASFGGSFPVVDGPPFRADLPMDAPSLAMLVKKTASVTEASVGDFIRYSVRVENRSPTLVRQAVALIDTMSNGLRYKKGSLRIAGRPAPDPAVEPSGDVLRISAGDIPVRGAVELSYLAEVTPAAKVGTATNSIQALLAGAPMSNAAKVGVRISPLLMADAATIIGRIVEGGCALNPKAAPGVAGVRVLMEDGTFVVSDRDGLFHFEGVRPGTHVVQLDLSSLPDGYEAVPCLRNTRHGGRAFSQFVDIRGGALWRTDFHLRRIAAAPKADGAAAAALPAAPTQAPAPATDEAAAAGGGRNWLAGQTPGNEWLFPEVDHNPRAPSVRAVVKHEAGSTVELSVNGERVSELTFDGTDESADKRVRVSRWRGLPLGDGDTRLRAVVKSADGRTVATLERAVHYANSVAKAVLVPERSRLVADGRTRAVVAVRLTDRTGRPVRQGVTGTFQLSAPYRVATEVDLQQARQLSGSDGAAPTYRVAGDDGIALIELAPTTQAGSIELTFTHEADRRRVVERLAGWMQPGDQPFIVVGFAAGTLGHEVLTDHAQRLDKRSRGLDATDGQASLFAKGRILGKWLMTLAYDSDKETGRGARRPLGGVIDPQRYYTVYADGTEQAYDAASTEKLYLRLERPQFYALFGDYETGLTQSQLARYSRSFTGVKSEYYGKHLSLNAFATETPFRYARDEIQGSGLSGPYRLSRRDIVLNSDKVRLETRDRLRSEQTIKSEELQRHIDYDVDYSAGTLRFRRAIPSRDRDLNPIFIITEYETEGSAAKRTNAGGRIAAKVMDGKLEAGASLIHDEAGVAKSDLAGADLRLKLGERTEVRAEAARSRGKSGGERAEGGAYLAEIEHRGEKLDALGYFRQQDIDFGVGQLNVGQGGTRKFGIDGRYRATDALSLSGGAWREEALVGGATREAGQAQIEYRRDATSLRAGAQMARDKIDGETLTSRQLTLGASHGFFDNRLVLDADTALSLGSAESLDFPNRYRVGAAYALKRDLKLVATHEITQGETVDAATTSLGVDAALWSGARLTSSVNQQAIRENGPRTFALYGLDQSVPLDEHWTVDASVDGSRTLKGAIDRDKVLNINHPVASGGYVGSGNTLSEDFWAFSAGAAFRTKTLSWTGRAEYRAGDLDDRIGLTTALLRQTQAGISFAASAQAYRARQTGGTTATLAIIDASVAYRPLGSRLAILDKLELRYDAIDNGRGITDGLLGADGLAVKGDAKSHRIINNLAFNFVSDHWTEDNRDGPGAALQRTQASIYYGSKYVLDRYDGKDFSGYTHLLGIEARQDLTSWLDLGLNAAVRHAVSSGTLGYSVGPSIGISPIPNAWLSIGYNLAGFEDRDFDDARYTRKGFFATLRFKFDQMTPADLFGRFARK
jgi:uncharacterized repeat protein (TIGR01451 family)